MKLAAQMVEKPWGRTALPDHFGDVGGRRIGEIWFGGSGADRMPLLVKYIFTSERLSIQVHPGDEAARERGHPHGKSECWYIVDAEPDAVVGIGLTAPMAPEALRDAALDGSIERRLNWKPARSGTFFHVPAGTVHAIGPGITLVEIQQNIDLTYRLYDYGRPRELHLDDGIAVAICGPSLNGVYRPRAAGAELLLSEAHFSVSLLTANGVGLPKMATDRDRWAIPLAGQVASATDRAGVGECLFVPARVPIELGKGGSALVAVATGQGG